MASETVGSLTVLPSGEIRNYIEEIASEVNIKDYEIFQKQEEFTGDNMCGDIYRIKVTPRAKIDEKPLYLIVKRAQTGMVSKTAMVLHDIYVAELFIYTDVIPAYRKLYEEFHSPIEDRFLSAQFYKGNNEYLKETIVLKDLSDDGFVMCDKKMPLNNEQVTLAVQSLAKIHAASFAMKEKNPKQYSQLCDTIPDKINYGYAIRAFKSIAQTIINKIHCFKARTKIECFVGKMEEILAELLDASLSKPFNVICHGDAKNNNMLFKYNKDDQLDQLVILDWQLARIASPLTDLAYFFCLSISPDMMESHLGRLLDLYYETLETCMNNMDCDVGRSFPKLVLLEHFKRFMPFGLAMALGWLPLALSELKTVKGWDKFDSVDKVCDVPYNDLVVERINGLVNYFVKHNLI